MRRISNFSERPHFSKDPLCPEFNNTTICNLAARVNPKTNLEKQVPNFWNLEEIPGIVGDTEKLSVEEIACERHFQENTNRDSEGRFVIRLPFKT
jgi:hypothetical protein